jgi:hypothetical protein
MNFGFTQFFFTLLKFNRKIFVINYRCIATTACFFGRFKFNRFLIRVGF